MPDDNQWDGVSMQRALIECDIVVESRVTDIGPGSLYFLKLGHKIIPLGVSQHFAETLQFALWRNARAFDAPQSPHGNGGATNG